MPAIAPKRFVIIVAGGSGKRMNNELPKQFMELNGLPVLAYSLSAFARASSDADIIVSIPEVYFSLWNDLVKNHHITTPHKLVESGRERFNTVKNSLTAIEGKEGLVAIHDAARPLISADIIQRSFKLAEKYSGVIPVIPVSQTLRKKETEKWKHEDRNNYVLVQTPQVFDIALLKEAYNTEFIESFTDDASVFEAAGFSVHHTEGDENNIKITAPSDMAICSVLLG